MQLQRVPLGSRYPWGLNLLSLDTATVKEVTKEGRDVSGLGTRAPGLERVKSLWCGMFSMYMPSR